jgi:hypothetical protein
VLLVVFVGACWTGDGTLDPAKYSQSCAGNADCVTVAVGTQEDACCSGCEASAIAKAALGEYQADMQGFCGSLAGRCPAGPTCPLPVAVCVDGACTTLPACTTMLVCPNEPDASLLEGD